MLKHICAARSGQLDFAEFLGMFSEDLLDLQELQRFLHMDAIPSCTWPLEDGKLIQVCSVAGAVSCVRLCSAC